MKKLNSCSIKPYSLKNIDAKQKTFHEHPKLGRTTQIEQDKQQIRFKKMLTIFLMNQTRYNLL